MRMETDILTSTRQSVGIQDNMNNLPEWLGRRNKCLHLQKQQRYKNPAQLLLLTEPTAPHRRPCTAPSSSGCDIQGQRSPSASATRQRAQTPAQRQGSSNPWSSTAWSCLHQPGPRLWNFSIGPSNARGKQILGAAYPGQGIHIKAGWKRHPNMEHPKKCPTPSGKDFTLLCTQIRSWLLSSYTSMPVAKSRKYVLSYSIQTCKCRGI